MSITNINNNNNNNNTFAVPDDDDDDNDNDSDLHSDDGSVAEVQVTSSAQTTPEQTSARLGSLDKPIEIKEKSYEGMVVFTDEDSDVEEIPLQPAKSRQYQAYVKDTYDVEDEQEARVSDEDFVDRERDVAEHDGDHMSVSDASELSHHFEEVDVEDEEDEQPDVMSSKRLPSPELGQPTHVSASQIQTVTAQPASSADDVCATAPTYQPAAPFDPVRSSVPRAPQVLAPTPSYPSTTTAFPPKSTFPFPEQHLLSSFDGSTVNVSSSSNPDWQMPSAPAFLTDTRRPFVPWQQQQQQQQERQINCISGMSPQDTLAPHLMPASSLQQHQRAAPDASNADSFDLSYEEPTTSTHYTQAHAAKTSMPPPLQRPWDRSPAAAAAPPGPTAATAAAAHGLESLAVEQRQGRCREDALPECAPRALKRKADDLTSIATATVVARPSAQNEPMDDEDRILVDPTSVQTRELPGAALQHLSPATLSQQLGPASDGVEEVALRPSKRAKTSINPEAEEEKEKKKQKRRRREGRRSERSREVWERMLRTVGTMAKYSAAAAVGGAAMLCFLCSEWAAELVA